MKTIEFSTGRTYNGHQVLKITYSPIMRGTDDCEGFGKLRATFCDDSRNIRGTVYIDFVEVSTTEREIGLLVQTAYDAGNYKLI